MRTNHATPAQPQADLEIPRVRFAQYACPHCWTVFFPGTPFPKGENSHICKGHYAWQLDALRAFYATKEGR